MKPRIVILGGGFAGAYCAQALGPAARRGAVEVTLLDRNNYFVFYPLLIEAGTGSLHPRHAVVSIRAFTRRCTFRMGEVTGADLEARKVWYRPAGGGGVRVLPFDHLVVTLGSVSRPAPVEGLEHAFHVKSLADAVALRDHAIRLLERADASEDPAERRALLRVLVVGGNFTGVEAAGEFEVFLRQACRRAYPSLDPREVQVVLVEATDRILPALDGKLADYALRKMRARGMEVRLRDTVARIDPEGADLTSGARLDTCTVIWCAGIAPNPLVKRLALPVDRQGYILCDPELRVRGLDRVWAAGDCAVVPDPGGGACPPTAQHAVRQGRHLAENLLRCAAGRLPQPFAYRSAGSLAALGCRTGVARVFGIHLSGFAAWFLWRTVYLLKMPGLARKLRVAVDWALDLLFARDFVQLGVPHSPPPNETPCRAGIRRSPTHSRSPFHGGVQNPRSVNYSHITDMKNAFEKERTTAPDEKR